MFRRLDVPLFKLFSGVLKNSPWGQRLDESFFWIKKKNGICIWVFFSKDSDVVSQVAIQFYFLREHTYFDPGQ